MKIELYTSLKKVPVDRDSWNGLLENNETNTPFQTWEWFKCWWSVHRIEQNPLVFTAHIGKVLVGLAPLMLSNRSDGQRVIEFSANDRSDYCDVICSEQKKDFIDGIIVYLIKHSHLWDTVNLRNIPEQSSTIRILESLCNHKNIKYLRSINLCATLVLHRCADIDKVAIPKSLRRHLNYLQDSKELSFRIIDNKGQALQLLDDFFKQHIERRSVTKDKSLFLEPTK